MFKPLHNYTHVTNFQSNSQDYIQKTKIMVSSPNTSWQIYGETMETVTGFILGGFRITADGDCSYLLLRRKAVANQTAY